MLKKWISSALALLAAAATGAVLVFALLPPTAVHSRSSQPDLGRPAPPAPVIAEQPAMNIVPSPAEPDGSVFIRTGDHSAGFWTR